MSTDHVVHAGPRLGHRCGCQGGRGAATAEHVSESQRLLTRERMLLGLMVVHRWMGTTVGLLLLLLMVLLLLLLQHLVWCMLMMLLLLLVLMR